MRTSGWKFTLFLVGLGISSPFAVTQAAPASSGHEAGMEWGAPGIASDADRTVQVTATDVAFDLKRLDVRVGETVRFVVTNKGETDHEFVLASSAEHAAHEQEMGSMDPGMAMPDEPNAVSLKPGQAKELVWKFASASDIQFSCDVPGHAEQGMKGDIDIKDR